MGLTLQLSLKDLQKAEACDVGKRAFKKRWPKGVREAWTVEKQATLITTRRWDEFLGWAVAQQLVPWLSVHGYTFEKRRFNAVNFYNMSFAGAIFDHCVFDRTLFCNCNFSGCQFVKCRLDGLNISLSPGDVFRFTDCKFTDGHFSRYGEKGYVQQSMAEYAQTRIF